jgi:hypothetical protein
MTSEETVQSPAHLTIEVFTTPGRPIVSSTEPGSPDDLPTWSPMSSTLIYGVREAVLVDAFATFVRQKPWPTGSTRRADGSHASTSPTATAIIGSVWPDCSSATQMRRGWRQ